MDFGAIFSSPFTWGLLLGLLFAGFVTWNYLRTKLEFSHYKKHLSDKLEIEASQYQRIKEEKEKLAQENENLRLKVGNFKESPTRELERELEIFARAEKRMVLNAPGFASAWESAKSAALDEIQDGERGKSLPTRIFRKFFKGEMSDMAEDLLAENSEAAATAESQETEPSEQAAASVKNPIPVAHESLRPLENPCHELG